MILRPVSPAEFAVRFGLEPVDVEWLMVEYGRGMSDENVRREIQVLGCSAGQAQRLLELIARRRPTPNRLRWGVDHRSSGPEPAHETPSNMASGFSPPS
jgi:hypothetical protein